jgi:hypothetical protein
MSLKPICNRSKNTQKKKQFQVQSKGKRLFKKKKICLTGGKRRVFFF